MQPYFPLQTAAKLPNSSKIDPVPASVSTTIEPGQTVNNSFEVTIGAGPSQFFYASESDVLAFLGGIVAGGLCVDENGQNALQMSVVGTTVTLSSGARLRLRGIAANLIFGSEVDAAAVVGRSFDTQSVNVGDDGVPVSERLAELRARFPKPDAVIRGVRSHSDYASLVAKGASAGQKFAITVGESEAMELTITANMSVFDVMGAIDSDPALNPDGPATRVGTTLGPFTELVIYSKTSEALAVHYTSDAAAIAAVLGSLPN